MSGSNVFPTNVTEGVFGNDMAGDNVDNGTTVADSPMAPFLAYTEFWIAYYLNKYYPWCLCALGILCNLVVFVITLLTKPFNTAALYVSTLAVVDSLALITKLSYTVLTAYDVPMGDTGCQIIVFAGYFIVQFSVWILVIITLERFIAVQFVFQVSSLFTMTRARLSLVVTAGLLLAVDSNLFWTAAEISDPVNGLQCGFRPEHKSFAPKIWNWIDAGLAFFLPCALLIVFNLLIIVNLHRRQIQNEEIFKGNKDIPFRARQQNRQLTVMLLTVSIGTTFFLLPLSIFYIVNIYWDYRQSTHTTAVFLLVTNIVHFLADCSHAMNFVFCFLGGSRFRRVLRSYLCKCRNVQNRRERKPTLSTLNSINTQSCRGTSISFINTDAL